MSDLILLVLFGVVLLFIVCTPVRGGDIRVTPTPL